ncbi:MAG: xanthine dehydrogenase family protein molybdopterin-binding subunit [Alphaproteobacteria bacterium]|nr:xanthine dehydrogenase family protein molybdopterin-binding subunit [Alphaproteobacteria bacterium]
MDGHAPHGSNYRYVARKRRTKEDKRFITGRGRYVADVSVPGMKHVAVIASPHAAARIAAIRTAKALAVPGVVAVVTGADIVAATNPMQHGLDIPGVRWYALAVDRARYAGEWVAAVVADSRYVAEDAAELIEVDYEPLPFVIDPEAAFQPGSPPVHPDHKSNVLFQRRFVYGDVDGDFRRADHTLSFRVRWGRSSTVPIETFGVLARWDEGRDVLDVWASIQMPKFHDQLAGCLRLGGNNVRVHYDVDVGGSYGTKRGIAHSVLVGFLARKLRTPVRFIEDRLEYMAGGGAHGPDRIFDMEVAFNRDGRVLSHRMRALDDVGCYPGRSPLQLGKPIGAIVGPYKIGSCAYEAISVTTNKTSQVAVRGFGQAPTNVAIETAMDRVAGFLGIDRLEVRRRNFIAKGEFPYLIPSGTTYDSGDYPTVLDKTVALSRWPELLAKRDALRAEGRLAGIGIATCLEPSGGNSAFEPLFNPLNDTTTWMESCQIKIDLGGTITAIIATSTSGQGHETLVATVIGEELERDPDTIRVVHSDSLGAFPSNSPVGSRMAIMLGGAASGAARQIRASLTRIAAHNFNVPEDRLEYESGAITNRNNTAQKLAWDDLVRIAHRKYHLMPPGSEPGLQATYCWEVPTGGKMPTPDGRVQMYPCFSFEAHVPLVAIDPASGKVDILAYFVGHDCGTVISPDIVRGITCGGIAHGIGAALYEKFEYDANGQLLAGTFADYLMPSAHEVPAIAVTEHCTPSPHTPMGQKGSGEAGYLGAPAAIASAVNDALAPLGLAITTLPMRLKDIEALLAAKSGPKP